MHALANTELVPGSNSNALVCSVYKNSWKQTELQCFVHSLKQRLLDWINCFVEAVSSNVPCAVLCLVDNIHLFV